jgi:hypothetical protein
VEQLIYVVKHGLLNHRLSYTDGLQSPQTLDPLLLPPDPVLFLLLEALELDQHLPQRLPGRCSIRLSAVGLIDSALPPQIALLFSALILFRIDLIVLFHIPFFFIIMQGVFKFRVISSLAFLV